jgi:hypothetical protein
VRHGVAGQVSVALHLHLFHEHHHRYTLRNGNFVIGKIRTSGEPFCGRGLSFTRSVNEQHRIVAKVHELMGSCNKLEAGLNTTRIETSDLLESVLHHALEALA